MPIGRKFSTNLVKQIWAITYFISVLGNKSQEYGLIKVLQKISIYLLKVESLLAK